MPVILVKVLVRYPEAKNHRNQMKADQANPHQKQLSMRLNPSKVKRQVVKVVARRWWDPSQAKNVDHRQQQRRRWFQNLVLPRRGLSKQFQIVCNQGRLVSLLLKPLDNSHQVMMQSYNCYNMIY